MIPAGCTSKCQPMDVCINKPFKANLRKCWVGYVAKMIDEKHDQIPPPSRQHMVDWVEEAYNAISFDFGMVKRSFDVVSHPQTKTKFEMVPFIKAVWKMHPSILKMKMILMKTILLSCNFNCYILI